MIIKNMLRPIIFSMLAFAFSAVAADTRWTLISGTGGADEYLDVSTVQRSGSTVTAWVMGDLKEARPFKGNSFRSLKTQMEFDCSAAKLRRRHVTLYAGQMGSGAVLESGYVSNPWEPAVPQSVGATKLQLVCGK